jgi:hypothetical protein
MSRPMKAPQDILDPVERAREKALSREDDARALATGEKSRVDLRRENAAFAFPRGAIRVDFSGRKF